MNTDVPKTVYTKILEVAASVVELPYPVILTKYTDISVYSLKHIKTGTEDNIIEARFDEIGVTLTCSFNKNNICDIAFLFWDNTGEIINLVHYLNNQYDYDFIQSRWMLQYGFLSVKVTNDDIYIIFYKK